MVKRNESETGLFKMIPLPEVSLNMSGGGYLMPTPKALDGVKGNLKTSQERLDDGRQIDLPNVAIDLAGGGLAANNNTIRLERRKPVRKRISKQSRYRHLCYQPPDGVWVTLHNLKLMLVTRRKGLKTLCYLVK